MVVEHRTRLDGTDEHLNETVSGAKSVALNVSDSVDVTVIRTGDNDWKVVVDARNAIGSTEVEVLREGSLE